MSNIDENEYVETAILHLKDGIILSRDQIEGLRVDISDCLHEIDNIEQQIDALAEQQLLMHNALDQLQGDQKEAKPKKKRTLDELIANAPDEDHHAKFLEDMRLMAKEARDAPPNPICGAKDGIQVAGEFAELMIKLHSK